MKKALLSIASVAAVVAFADMSVTGVSVAQDESKCVTVDYTLSGGPAIVTVDFLTNGVSVGEKNFANIGGDVNMVVKNGARKIFWRPDRDWGGNVATECTLTANVTAWDLKSPPNYMVIDGRILMPKKNVRFYVSADALPEGGLENRSLYAGMYIVFRKIPAKNVRWRMGSTAAQRTAIGYTNTAYEEREIPHYVTLTNDYYLGIYPLTQRQSRSYWGAPRNMVGYDRDVWECLPANNIAYSEIRGSSLGAQWPTETAWHNVDSGSLLAALRERTGIPTIDLPTMARWEFAYRAGQGTLFYNGSEAVTEQMTSAESPYAWYSGNSSAIQPVGLLAPNPWGLYDMAGNVHELCLDWFWQKWYNSPNGSEATEPAGPELNQYTTTRVARGGARSASLLDMRASSCSMIDPSNYKGEIGLRLCCEVDMAVLAE